MKSKVTLLNMLSGLLQQICAVLCGFIVPKILLNEFGSNLNGMVGSIAQFLSYISIVEGGISGVILANLYKPLIAHDYEKLSSVLVTARQFYMKIGIIYIIYSLVIAIIFPLSVNEGYFFVFSLTLILSITSVIQYLFSLTYQSLLIADKRGYIINFVQIMISISNVVLAYISVKIFPSIHMVKFITGFIYILQPLVYGTYVKKTYRINWRAKVDNNLVKERWNGFAINIAAFIHESTDVTVLTFLSDFSAISVYGVYSLVINGLKRLISALTSGINPIIGQAYAKNDYDELGMKLDIYEYIVFVTVTFCFSITALIITPFVKLYTYNIHDANYIQPFFGYMLVLSEALYLIKLPHLNLAYSANKFQEITKAAYIEAIINIIVSVLLVKPLGLIGIAIGTSFAMAYRMIFHVYYTSKLMPERRQIIFYKKLFVFSAVAFVGIVLCEVLFPKIIVSILDWLIHFIEYCVVFFFILLGISMIGYKKELFFFAKYLKLKR